MSNNNDPEKASLTGYDPSFQTENIAFARVSMLNCSSCSRSNPPNRLKCLYCGRDMESPNDLATSIRPDLRKLESWERGVNVVFRDISATPDMDKAAAVLSLGREDLIKAVETGHDIPIARVESEREALLVIEKLGRLGLQSYPVSDDVLALNISNIRVSGLEFLPGQFGVRDFNTSEITQFAADDIALIVEGVISKTKIDTVEKRQIRGESKLLDQSMIAADDPILDIYPANADVGFRVFPMGFDFSCLGDQKSLLARENWGRLIDMLKASLPNARFDDSFLRIRDSLAIVWPIEVRNETKGMIQTGFGKREFGSVSTTSNLEQFNRYSRLQRHLL